MPMSADSWDDFGKSESMKSEPTDKLNTLARELYSLEVDLPNKIERIEQLRSEIALLFPEEEGENSASTDNFVITCTRGERWTWHKAMLEEIFGEGELPEYVTRSLSVDKRKFKKLPSEDQNQLKQALTRKLDKAKVKVVQNV